LGLLLAATHSEENSAQELLGELFVQTEQAQDSPHEIDVWEDCLQSAEWSCLSETGPQIANDNISAWFKVIDQLVATSSVWPGLHTAAHNLSKLSLPATFLACFILEH
jgi:hypothetical protein